jgi:hypothetical protein
MTHIANSLQAPFFVRLSLSIVVGEIASNSFLVLVANQLKSPIGEMILSLWIQSCFLRKEG